MPVISMFYGIIVYLYYFDDRQHKLPHIHAEYQNYKIVVEIENSEILAGEFPTNKLRLLQAWIEIHREELLADWKLATNGLEIFKIDPLK